MMGRQRRDQGKLFYEFRLEDRIPENHLLRRINVFVTTALADLHKPPSGQVNFSGHRLSLAQDAAGLPGVTSRPKNDVTPRLLSESDSVVLSP